MTQNEPRLAGDPRTIIHERVGHTLMLSAIAALTGCSYTSAYVPPQDGRARVVWLETTAVTHRPPVNDACLARMAALSRSVDPRSPTGGVWTPGAEEPDAEDGDGPRVQVQLDVGGASSSGGRVGGRGGRPNTGRGIAQGARPGHHGAAKVGGGAGGKLGGSKGGSGGSGGGGGGGGGKGLGGAAVALIVLAYLVAPIGAVLVSTGTPEDERVSYELDDVSTYNDLVRAGDPECLGGAP